MSTAPLHPPASWLTTAAVTLRNLWQRVDGAPEPAPAATRTTIWSKTARDRTILVSLILAVCLAIFGTKVYIGFRDCGNEQLEPYICDGQVVPSLARIWLCTTEDFAVGLGCLLALDLALRLTAWRWYRRGLRVLAYLAAAIATAYMVANAQLFHTIRHFLNLSLFQLGGGFHPEHSVQEAIPLALKLAVAVIPLATIALQLLAVQLFPRFWRRLAYYLCRPVRLTALMVVLVALAAIARGEEYCGYETDFPRSPHLLLAESFFAGGIPFGDDGDGDDSDFLPGRPHHSYDRLEEERWQAQRGSAFTSSAAAGPLRALPLLRLDPPAPARPTNVILIVLESAATAYWQNYGAPFPTTPHLCGDLKDKSITWDNFYSTDTHTIASALLMFGSAYNDCTTISTVMKYPDFPVPAVPAWLQKQGYRTHFLGGGGEDVWQKYRDIGSIFLPHGFDLARCGHRHWSEQTRDWPFLEDAYTDPRLFEDAGRIIQEAQRDRAKFFLMMWNYDTHFPYTAGARPPQPWDESRFPAAIRDHEELKEQFRKYLSTIWQVDLLVAKLYRQLEEANLADDTLIVVTGDHGEAFGQHGGFTHGHSLHEEEIHVPLIFINPRLAHLGPRRETVGSHVDLWSTITDVCAIRPDPRWQGHSLLAEELRDQRRAYFYGANSLGIREGKYKFIWNYSKDRESLYDLERDPEERQNIARQHRDYCNRQRRRLKDWTNYQIRWTQEQRESGTR